MRQRYIQDHVTGEILPADEYHARKQEQDRGPMIIGDIAPYRSMLTGETIDGRRAHREHLRQHGVVEVGDAFDKAVPKPCTPPKGLKETLIRVAYDKLRY